MSATILNKKGVVTKLLNLGANPLKGNKYGGTALSMALREGYEELGKIFVQKKIFEFEMSKYSIYGDYLTSQINNEELQKYLGLDLYEVRKCVEEVNYYNNKINGFI